MGSKVLAVYNNFVIALMHERGNVKSKGSVTADVTAGILAVYPYKCLIVGCSEVQYHTSVKLGGGKRKASFVPHRVHEIGISDPRKLAFRAERNDNFAIEAFALVHSACIAAVAEVKRKVPFAVKVHIVFSHKLRIRMLISRYHINLHAAQGGSKIPA